MSGGVEAELNTFVRTLFASGVDQSDQLLFGSLIAITVRSAPASAARMASSQLAAWKAARYRVETSVNVVNPIERMTATVRTAGMSAFAALRAGAAFMVNCAERCAG